MWLLYIIWNEINSLFPNYGWAFPSKNYILWLFQNVLFLTSFKLNSLHMPRFYQRKNHCSFFFCCHTCTELLQNMDAFDSLKEIPWQLLYLVFHINTVSANMRTIPFQYNQCTKEIWKNVQTRITLLIWWKQYVEIAID